VKKSALTEFSNPRSTESSRLTLDGKDELIARSLTDGRNDFPGQPRRTASSSFPTEMRRWGRNAGGVNGMDLDKYANFVEQWTVQPDFEINRQGPQHHHAKPRGTRDRVISRTRW